MSIYLRLKSNKIDSTGVVLINGTSVTTYIQTSEGLDAGIFGAPSFNRMFATPIDGTPGKIGDTEELRQFSLPILVSAASQSALVTAMGTLMREIEDVNQHGGRLRFRPDEASYACELEVHAIDVSPAWSHAADAFDRQRFSLSFTVSAYALADPMDISDDFSADTFGTAGKYNNGGADWTAIAGALTNMPVTSGALDANANLATENVYIHTGAEHTYGDVAVMADGYFGSIANTTKIGLVLKYIDASNYLEAYVDDTGAATRIRIDAVIAAVRTNVASTSITRLTTTDVITIRACIAGNRVHIGHRLSAMGMYALFDTSTAKGTLTTAQAAVLGSGIRGRVGISCLPVHTGTWVSGFKVFGGMSISEHYSSNPRPIYGTINGSAKAKADIILGGSDIANGASIINSWWQRHKARNLIPSGGQSTGAWKATAVTGVQTNAATSVAGAQAVSMGSDTYRKRIGQSLLVTCPATTDTGGNFFIPRVFYAGTTYTVSAYVRAASGTTSVRVKLGVSGDVATGTSTPLSAAWQLLSTTWTPTTTVYGAYFACTIASASAQAFYMVPFVYEGTTQPSDDCLIPAWEAFGLIGGAGWYAESSGGGGSFANATDASSVHGITPSLTGALSAGSLLFYNITSKVLRNQGTAQSGSFPIDIYALISHDSTRTTLNVKTKLSNQYTYPYGSTGKSISPPSSGDTRRWYYLGRVEMQHNSTDNLSIEFDGSSGSTLILDSIALIDPNSTTATVTGMDTNNNPSMGAAQRIAHDLAVYTISQDTSAQTSVYDEQLAGGVGGSNIFVPTTSTGIDLLTIVSSRGIENPTSDTSDATAKVELTSSMAITPRYHIAAGV